MKKTYFFSDIHLGAPSFEDSLRREKLLVELLDKLKEDAEAFYFLGDVFDYWYEYKRVVLRGFVRFLGKLAEIADSGIPIHYYTGNHDIWVFDYLPNEIGLSVYREPGKLTLNGKKFYIGHGDGLGPHDKYFKMLKKMFTSKVLQWCFSRIHPNYTAGFAYRWSHRSRKFHKTPEFLNENEWLVEYSRSVLETEHFDYFIFGHRHIPKVYSLSETSTFINVGDWLRNFSYVVFDGEKIELVKME